MIVDWFMRNGEVILYLRTRDKDGNLTERYIEKGDSDFVKPFCWIPKNSSNWKLQRLIERYPDVRIHFDETATGLDGRELIKLTIHNPTDLWDIKSEMSTYEADLNYNDQILLTLYPDKIPEFHPRVWYFDLEWHTKRDFTTVMAVVDSDMEYPTVFAWRPDVDTMQVNWIEREGGYFLHEFGSEAEMHDAFLDLLEERDPDILVAHALMWADLPHLMKRLENPDRLSPVRRATPPFKDKGYKETQQPIKGRLCWDSASRWQTGSGFETLWQKSGRGQLPNRKLNTIAELLNLGSKLTEEIEGMTVHNGWQLYYDHFVDYCLRDTTLLSAISNRLNAIEFFVAMQQLCGVSWGSTHKVTRYFRGLVGRRTELKAPSAKNVYREPLVAAHIPDPIPGRHEGVAIVDYASLYPNIILSDNLCYTTKRQGPGPGIKQLGNGTFWDQTQKGLLPSIVEEMLALRKEFKQKMKDAKTSEERLGYDMLQTAAKVAVNALYGMCGMKSVQGMWVENDIASSITFRGREAIRHLLSESEEQGYKSLYGHTDSAFIQVPFDKAEELAEHLTKTAREKLNLSHMDVELEAYFDYWTTAPVKNRYFGYKTWPESEKGQLKVTGYAIKASSSAPITKKVQSVAMELVGHGASEDEVTSALRKIATEVQDGSIPITDVACSTRISKPFKDYKSPTPGVKAALAYNAAEIGEEWKQGDSVSWVYTASKEQPYTAFREAEDLADVDIDWNRVLDVLVRSKLQRIYESLGWQAIEDALGALKVKSYF